MHEPLGGRASDVSAEAIHRESIVIDTMGSWTLRRPTAIWDGLSFIEQALRAGVSAMLETVVADTELWDLHTVLRWIDDVHWMLARYPTQTLLVQTSADLARAKTDAKLGLIMGFQGANGICEDLALLRLYHHLGVRSMGLTYMRANALGSGCMELVDGGLTYFGRRVVREMNHVGMAVDLSHVGVKTSLQAIDASEMPVVFTHSNVRALTAHPRNVTDEQLRALAANGGVIGITPVSIFCRKTDERPTIGDFLDHLDHAVEVAGIEHVGIATDRLIADVLDEQLLLSKEAAQLLTFGLSGKHVDGFHDFQSWPNVARSLLARGYTRGDIVRILGGNFQRVFGQIWRQ